ncbi:MAG: tRNA 2-thiouridine(34) synthase MnmA [Gammaproteobacteria bacterium]
MTAKVIAGLSGGVDSSVAALQLLEQGCEVEALFMKNWHERDAAGDCTWEADVEDALAVCDKLGIPLNTIDLSAAYRDKVFGDFLHEYQQGLTPNPDILCNQEIKFRAFMDHALGLGAGLIATGHYARISEDDDGLHLLKGLDAGKDQSYFLCRLNQRQLRGSLFPVGDLQKSAVRALAKKAGLPTHDKKDSTGICFIGEQSFRDFLSRYLPVDKGAITTADGRIIGEHDGVHFYTLGQRHGLGIGGVKGCPEEPWYVIGKDRQTNTLMVAQGHNHPDLLSRSLQAHNMNWINNPPATDSFTCMAKTRYRQADQPCTVTVETGNPVRVEFRQPQRAVTPGQYVVLYDGDECLGGGVIGES